MYKLVVGFWLAGALACQGTDVAEFAKSELAKVVPETITRKSDNGRLYSRNELEHLSRGALAGGKVVQAARTSNKKNADPVAALKHFNDQLKALNIQLIVVPVPPKMAIYPPDGLKEGEAMEYLKPLYAEMRQQGLNVFDPSDIFLQNKEKNVYCRTDAHWSPAGIALVAEALSRQIAFRGGKKFETVPVKAAVSGDLARSLSPKNPEQENLSFQTVPGKVFDENSPILLLGDSHTLIFSNGGDMLAEKAGLGEQLALLLGTPIDRIGAKGSAATAVRIDLYRKSAKLPEWLKNKKYVIYCFSCREFTESYSGWAKIPVVRPPR